MVTILSSLDGVGRLSLMLTVDGGGVYELAQDESASLKSCGEEVDERPLCSAAARARRSL